MVKPTFTKATKFDAKLRLGLAGPPGSGKTYTSVLLATELAEAKRVALIDTEHGSAAKAAGEFDFDTLRLDTFHPDRYVEAIHAAEEADYGALVIDSLSHAWKGKGGLLEEVDRIAATKYKGNTYMAWNDAGVIQNDLVQTILTSPLHIIATARSKTDYVVERNEQTGKMSPRKVGLAPVQRDDLPYEFDIWGSMSDDNTLMIEKSRCKELAGAVIRKPGIELARTLQEWLRGDPPPPPSDIEFIQAGMLRLARLGTLLTAENEAVTTVPAVKALCLLHRELPAETVIGDLTPADLAGIRGWTEDMLSEHAHG